MGSYTVYDMDFKLLFQEHVLLSDSEIIVFPSLGNLSISQVSMQFIFVFVLIYNLFYYMYFSDLFSWIFSLTKPAHDKVYSIQHYVIKFISNFQQDGGFLWFPLPIKLI